MLLLSDVVVNMKKTIKNFIIISSLLFVWSCEAQNSTTIPNSSMKSQTNQPTDSLPINSTSLIDSIRPTVGIEDLNACMDYLELYYESNSIDDLDSAVFRFEKFTKRNKVADPYLRMGATCELLEEHDLAEKYYKEGKSLNINNKNTPESVGQMEKMFHLYDYYFSLLLNETVDLQKLTLLEKELSDQMLMFSMMIPESNSRDELLDAFSF